LKGRFHVAVVLKKNQQVATGNAAPEPREKGIRNKIAIKHALAYNTPALHVVLVPRRRLIATLIRHSVQHGNKN